MRLGLGLGLGLPPALHLYRARQEGGYGLLSSIRYNLPA
jgi:hypothetical protein